MKCFDNSKNVAGLRTFKTTFLNAKTWLTLQSFYHFNILVNTSVETSAIAKKCEFCAKTVILESISAYVIVMFCKKKKKNKKKKKKKKMKTQKLPDGGAETRRS